MGTEYLVANNKTKKNMYVVPMEYYDRIELSFQHFLNNQPSNSHRQVKGTVSFYTGTPQDFPSDD
jgi:hypothetical protein